MQHRYLSLPFPYNSFPCPRINGTETFRRHLPQLHTPLPASYATIIPFFARNRRTLLIRNPTPQNGRAFSTITNSANGGCEIHDGNGNTKGKSFWGAVSLIIGTAVGPGMLGLPALTVKSGPLPSTILILLSWVYVISSIILVAELSFAAMEEDKIEEA